jgi:alpha-mannosidase
MSRCAKHLSRLVGFSFLIACALSHVEAQVPQPWPPEARQYRFHMIGGAHIDPVWLWPWSEGLSVVHSTFRSALDRMKETPNFAFTASSAQFYEWVAQNDPKMLAEIRQRVEEGRWAIVGGWWVEPDVNLPSGEALARHGLYGQRLFKQLFGTTSRVGYCPDSFGHPGTLPQILKLQGMDSYVFMRPMPQEKKLPSSLFWWEGPDGSRLLTYRIPFSYNDEGPVEGRLREIIPELHEPTQVLMAFYGVGDHGGGPTKQSIQSILELAKLPGAPTAVFSTPERYFEEIRKITGLELPVVRDDLQMHAVGCYTAESEIKKNNRAAETLLVTGEKLATLASVIADRAYPQAELTAAWKKVLFQQFHDILAGSSLPEAYTAAREAHGYALEVANHALYEAAQKIAWQVPTEDPQSEYLVVFNPHAWNATLDVEYDLGWPPQDPRGSEPREVHSVLEDETGTAMAYQWAQASTVIGRQKLVFRAPVPAVGYRQFRLRNLPGTAEPTTATALRARERELENEHLRVSLAADGTISILDKDSGRQVFRTPGGARGVILEDLSDTWSHGISEYSKEIGAFANAQFRVLESGPLRARVRVRSTYGRSALEVDWLLYAGSRTLEARVALDWHEHQKMLKFSFPVAVEEPSPTFETPYGHIVRQPNGAEVPGQRWVDLSGKRPEGTFGLAIVNDAKYGYSVQGDDLRISIVRGAVYAQHQPYKLVPDGEYIWQDQGQQTMRLLLVPHSGMWQDVGVVRMTEEYATPVPVMYQGIHPGHRPLSASFLSVDAPNVVVSALKKAEDGQDLIVRCYETAGRATKATVDLALVNRRWTGNFRPSEIKTLRVPSGGGPIREVNLIEE